MDDRQRLRRARKIQAAIDQVLLRDWDPIGVRDEPMAQDEYSRYVGGVYRLLASGASAEQVAQHLLTIETESMGMDPRDIRSLLPVAEQLCRLPISLHEEGAAGEQ